MKAKKYQIITICLVLMFCLIGAVSATEDISTDTPNTATTATHDQSIITETPHEDLNEKVSSTTPTKTVTDDTPKEKTNKEKIGTNDNTEPQKTTNNKTETPTTKPAKNKLKAQNNNENTLTETNTEPLKSGNTKTVYVNNYDELTEVINNAVEDTENDTYIINLNTGTYELDSFGWYEFYEGSTTPNIIINANKQELTEEYSNTYFLLFNNCNITLNEAHLKHGFQNYNENSVITICNSIIDLNPSVSIQNSGTLTIINSTINARIQNSGTLTITDDVIFGENFNLQGNGQIITNKTLTPYLPVYDGNYILENLTITASKTNNGNLTIRNSTINSQITNNGNLTIRNSTINSQIVNNGKLTICDDVILGNNFVISGNGQIITNKSLVPYLAVYDGNYVLENLTTTSRKTNNGNLTIRNSTLSILNNGNVTLYDSTINSITNNGNITTINTTFNAMCVNNGNLTIKNSTINSEILNYGKLILDDDVIFTSSCVISGNGQIIINDENKLIPYLTVLNGDYILENLTITSSKTNNGNLTIRNATINGYITNNGNLTIENSNIIGTITNNNNGILIIKNSTVNRIQNKGTVILDDDITLGPSFYVTGGKVIANDYSKIFPYLAQFTGETTIELGNYNNYIQNYGNLTIENTTFNNQVINSGKITIINSTTKNKQFSNSGTMEFRNSTINTTIQNTGILIISEDTILGENFKITAGWGGVEGQVITNNTQLIDYVDIYKGNIELINKTITTPKTNKGTLTLTNCTINSTITNDGTIIIDEDTVFGENAKITGTGKIETNNISKILPIIDTINGNYEIKDTTLTKNYAFNGEITLINCTTNNPDNTNFGTLTIINCTVNVGEDNTFLTNYGTTNINKNTTIIGKIIDTNNRVFYEGIPKIYNINNDVIDAYFDENGLNSIIRPEDILNFQGNIILNYNLIINTPVNIISENACINGNSYKFIIESDYTNITGIYFNNTQLVIKNKHITLEDNNITANIILDGSNNTITNNNIITDDEYTITSTIGQNNIITGNYLVAKTLIGDKTVNLDASNIIENNIPLNVKIEITVNPENTVNKTATIIIVLKDENDNLIANQKVNLTIGSSTQEVDLKNGFILYTYTPETIGEDTVTVKYNGDGIYLPATNDTILNVTADKDKIIQTLEDANETNTQRISDLNKEITNQTETIDELNNTVKAQNTTIQNQDKTIQSQTQQITEANNKVAVAEQKASQATVPIKTVKASKTVKKSKNYKIKVTLKKAVKGKKVFVIFNGKTYTKKTNKKGIATITIKKSALKKLGGKKVKYQIISGEKIIKKTVKVKK